MSAGEPGAPPEAPRGHWVLCVTFAIKPEYSDEFIRIVSEVIDRMRHEPNFVTTTLCRDPAVAGRFFLFETWKSRSRFLAEDLSRDYRTSYSQRLAEIQAEERWFEEWQQIRADYSLSTPPS